MENFYRASRITKILSGLILLLTLVVLIYLIINNSNIVQMIIIFPLIALIINIVIYSFSLRIIDNKLVIGWLIYSNEISCFEITYIGKRNGSENPFERSIFSYVIKCRNEGVEKSYGIPKPHNFRKFISDIHNVNAGINFDC